MHTGDLGAGAPAEPLAAPAWPFFYAQVVDTLEAGDWSNQSTVCILGARGTGRTAVLDEFGHRVGGKDGGDVFVLRGRDTLAFRRKLSRFAVTNPDQHLLIDDLDHVLTELLMLDESPVSGSDADRSIKESLEIAIQNTRARNRVCLVSSAVPPAELFPPTHSLSLLLQKFQIEQLRPWRLPWHTLLSDLTSPIRTEFALPRLVRVGGSEYAFGLPELQRWQASTLSLTGGHPLLMGPALRGVRQLLNESANLSPAAATQPLPTLLIEQYIQHYVSEGIGVLRKRIRALESSKEPNLAEAYSFLRHLAAVPADTAAEHPKIVRDILERAGLICSLDDVYWHVPGVFIRIEVDPSAKPITAEPEAEVRPRVGAEHSRGTLLVRMPSGPRSIALTGRAWQLVQIMIRAHPDAASNSELQAAGLPSEAALRSAIQRLDKKLKENGLGDLLENSRGEGYRLAVRLFGR